MEADYHYRAVCEERDAARAEAVNRTPLEVAPLLDHWLPNEELIAGVVNDALSGKFDVDEVRECLIVAYEMLKGERKVVVGLSQQRDVLTDNVLNLMTQVRDAEAALRQERALVADVVGWARRIETLAVKDPALDELHEDGMVRWHKVNSMDLRHLGRALAALDAPGEAQGAAPDSDDLDDLNEWNLMEDR